MPTRIPFMLTLATTISALMSACEGYEYPDFGSVTPNTVDTDTGQEGEAEPDEAFITATVAVRLEGSTFGAVAWYDAGQAFAISSPDEDAPARRGAGTVSLVDTSGVVQSRVTGPSAGAGLGSTLTVVDDLIVSGTASGSVYGWVPEDVADVAVEEIATVALTGAGAAPSVAPVGDAVWIVDPSDDGAALYAVTSDTFLSGVSGALGDQTVISQAPCGYGIPSCGLTMAPDPTGNGVLLGLSGGYAQHVEADGTSDWYLAGRFVRRDAIPTPPPGVSSVFAVGDRFVSAGYLDGPEVMASARWLLPKGEIDDGALDPYPGVFSVAVGVLDGVPYRVYGIGDGSGAVAFEPDDGQTSPTFLGIGDDCQPRVATDGGSKVLIVCEGETYGVIVDLAWEE